MNNNEPFRAFCHSNKAWYGASCFNQAEIHFGMYAEDHGCIAEMGVVWKKLGDDLVPQIQIFDDAWGILADMKDLVDELAKHKRKNISDDEFAKILLSLGFKDITEYEMPEKMRPKQNKKINFIDSNYKPLFSIDDGGEIEIQIEPCLWNKSVCIYIDEYHFRFGGAGGHIYHVYQFAQEMETNNRAYRPVNNGRR